MASALVSLRAISAACTSLAHSAAPIMRKVAGPGFGNCKTGMVNKDNHGDFDPQTAADRRTQRFLVGGLRATFPAIRIVGEEGDLGENSEDEEDQQLPPANFVPDLACLDGMWQLALDRQVPADELCIWLDPLDGTKEFVTGHFQYVSILIGVCWKGRPVVGVVCEPYYFDYHAKSNPEQISRTLWGSSLQGVGVHILGDDSWKPPSVDPARCIVETSRSRTDAAITKLVDNMPPGRVTEHMLAGGSGHKLARIIDGIADLWVYPGSQTCKWDTCAGEALVEAIGGCMTDTKGNMLEYNPDSASYYNREGVLAARTRGMLDMALKAAEAI